MSKRMLIDASHPEETRVVVLDGNKVEEFDFESASRRPLKGNIYLAKVTRVEPSLQAAFVEYGGNRQGFLAFSEIHPDYYQIPVADRLALLADQSRRLMEEDDEIDSVAAKPTAKKKADADAEASDEDSEEHAEDDVGDPQAEEVSVAAEGNPTEASAETNDDSSEDDDDHADEDHDAAEDAATIADDPELERAEAEASLEADAIDLAEAEASSDTDDEPGESLDINPEANTETEAREPSQQMTESTGAPVPMERRSRRRPPRRRQYKIQEVIRRKQIILIQVVKEERGNKGASVTTYLSLPGRYCVLMPNTPRGGGISRKITSLADRKRLKAAAQSLELPEGMGLIIRTAGANRTKAEIKRDYEYLLRMWDSVRELTLKSNAPALVYEEGNLIKRSIRDLYGKEVSEVLVDGDGGYREAKDFMRMLMPSHAKNVKPYKDTISLFQRHHVESQLDAMFSPVVTLRSGGYIVINQTEALVSIDVNSGKATREHSIEDTAYKTNLEAADEIARQLRLRDLAGLIVIDFIDMEDGKNDRNVEKRLRDALRNDRARIQVGKISQFGLLEMSRQRLRAGVLAGSTVACPHCEGLGFVRSTESAALQLLRSLYEEALAQYATNLVIYAPTEIIIYVLNHKRAEISRIEEDYDMPIAFVTRDSLSAGKFEIERIGKRAVAKQIKHAPIAIEAVVEEAPEAELEFEETPDEEIVAETSKPAAERDANDDSGGRRRRRRRRRGGRGRNQPGGDTENAAHSADADVVAASEDEPASISEEPGETESVQAAASSDDSNDRRRRRRRRGRRGRRRDQDGNGAGFTAASDDTDEAHSSDAIDDDAESMGTAEPLDANEASSFEIVPNAPSEPQWSFSSDAKPSETVSETDEDDAPLEPVAQVIEKPAAAAKVEKIETPPEPPKKGWWQKRLGI